jgi:hypothetical protein
MLLCDGVWICKSDVQIADADPGPDPDSSCLLESLNFIKLFPAAGSRTRSIFGLGFTVEIDKF